ncbi:helix-turn-helix domain-containing protein [Flavobacterium pectinovorum]|uniref:winged helix-turn-helix transcriptional regulator n=1 Tax=Flavobacterium pectinovorum TaxID=29533 RepID=UPI00265FC902|nr:helix-turn-helix domain-containing protein [Flavobacterium pectinovorum]WKL49589.1 helix-turn-helix domain-containing protein [Flavobacterium pectinovorum]
MTKSSHSGSEDKRCEGNFMLALTDTLNVVSGKWKLPIIGTLMDGKMRFKQIENHIPNINSRMLSKELKDLEANGIVTRTAYNTVPVCVEYELTASGYSVLPVLEVMVDWGRGHRQNIIGQ